MKISASSLFFYKYYLNYGANLSLNILSVRTWRKLNLDDLLRAFLQFTWLLVAGVDIHKINFWRCYSFS